MSATRFIVAVALLGGLATGCKESLGERCEITSDCESGLVCQIQAMTTNGICVNPNVTSTPDASTVDSAVVVPPTPDAAADARADAASDGPSDARLDARVDGPAAEDAASDARD